MSISVFGMSASMRGIPLVIAAMLAVASCMPNSPPDTSGSPLLVSSGAQAVPGEVLVQFRPGTSSARIQEILADTGARIEKSLGTPLVYMVRPSDGRSADELVARLRAHREVMYAEPNRLRGINPSPALQSPGPPIR